MGPLRIVLECDVRSKKNIYSQTKAGRRFKPKSVVDTENIAMMQIPPEYYGLELRHPAIVFGFQVPKKSMALDRDGIIATTLDFLVKFKILKDDCIRQSNGLYLLLPATEGDRKKFTIDIYPDGKIPGVNI